MPYENINLETIINKKDLIEWLETMPPEGTFDYMSNSDCLFVQYLKAKGIDNPRCGGGYFRLDPDDNTQHMFSREYNSIATETNTFGKALELARQLPD